MAKTTSRAVSLDLDYSGERAVSWAAEPTAKHFFGEVRTRQLIERFVSEKLRYSRLRLLRNRV